MSSGAYDEAFKAASASSGIPFNTLKALSIQEGVDPRYNNPMGRSDNAGVFHYTKAEANEMIMRQAMLPYMRKDFGANATPEDLRRGYQMYSPPGARNDLYGTNASKQSETEAIIAKLNRSQPTSSATPASGHTFNYHIHADGADKGAVASIKDALKEHTTHFLEQMQRADQESYRRSFA